MTEQYDHLKTGPRTNIDRSRLRPTERAEVRSLSVQGRAQGQGGPPNATAFTTVYYLAGDEQAAAERFAEENAAAIAALELSGRNLLSQSLDRELYDLVLDAAGERDRTVYETVVLETRPDGTQYLIDREHYETAPNDRYKVASDASRTAKVPPETSLSDLYAGFEDVLTATDLEATALEGDVRQVLDYYRVAEEYACIPTTTEDGRLAIRKRKHTRE